MKTNAILWKDKDGKPISCQDKLEILHDNLNEIIYIYNQIKEEAILLGVSSENFIENISQILQNSN